MVSLVAGIFKYQIMAIGSGSMEPQIYRGDAVVFAKVTGPEDIHVGEVLVFKHNGTYVTHRVKSIDKRGNGFRYVTKGDNNNDVDNFVVTDKDAVGIVKLRVKYIGFPTLWIQALFE